MLAQILHHYHLQMWTCGMWRSPDVHHDRVVLIVKTRRPRALQKQDEREFSSRERKFN